MLRCYKVSMYSRDKNCRMTSKKWKGREFTVAVKAVGASICSLRVNRREKSLKFRSTFGDDSTSSLAVTQIGRLSDRAYS